MGVRSDGTVVAVGDNASGQCDVGGWTDITEVAASIRHTVGLKSDGTVVAVGDNASGQCDVEEWTGIAWIAAGAYHTVGLKSDGTAVVVGLETELAKWNLRVAGSGEMPPVSWPLIGGVIALAAAALAIFLVHRKSRADHKALN